MKYVSNCDRTNENQIRKKATCIKTLHRVSGYDARAENVESRDYEEDEAGRLAAISLVSLKTKLLIK